MIYLYIDSIRPLFVLHDSGTELMTFRELDNLYPFYSPRILLNMTNI